MPNHVHALVQPLGTTQLAEILHSWKSFSASQINAHLGKAGSFWKKEYYDHIVRDLEELRRIRKYIRDNPKKAGIRVAHSSFRTANILSASGSPLEAGGTAHRTASILEASAKSPLEAGDTPVPPASCGQPKEKK